MFLWNDLIIGWNFRGVAHFLLKYHLSRFRTFIKDRYIIIHPPPLPRPYLVVVVVPDQTGERGNVGFFLGVGVPPPYLIVEDEGSDFESWFKDVNLFSF